MTNHTFLDFLINILFFTLWAAVIAAVIVIFLIVKKGIISQKHKAEFPEKQTAASKTKIHNTLSKSEIEELLSKLEREKRAITLGYNMMSSTHKEATKNKLLRIEQKLRQLNAIRVC